MYQCNAHLTGCLNTHVAFKMIFLFSKKKIEKHKTVFFFVTRTCPIFTFNKISDLLLISVKLNKVNYYHSNLGGNRDFCNIAFQNCCMRVCYFVSYWVF